MIALARRRNLCAALAAAALVCLAAPSPAGARAGGGSFHFGGGGGGRGGGGGGGFHGPHFFFFGGGGGGLLILIAVIVIVILIIVIVGWLKREAIALRYARLRRERARRVELAAAEAGDEDPDFAPDIVLAGAEALFRELQGAWDGRDARALAARLGEELWDEWQRRLADFERKGWHSRVEVLGDVKVSYIGLTNRADDRDDRVVVHIAARLRDYVIDSYGDTITRRDQLSEISNVSEYWTLGKRDRRWILLSIEQEEEGRHELSEQIVATPWSDDRALHDEAVVEQAQVEAVPAGVAVAEVADLDFEGDARIAALDLSLADGRFAPDVLEVAVRRAVESWAEAIDGHHDDLISIATPDAVQQLLHPGDPSGKTRVVVRGPRVRRLTIAALDAADKPPTMKVEVHVTGRHYVEDRDTLEPVSGSQSRETQWVERWRLALDGPADNPWRIVGTA
ncbi:MAG TPA: TIM44-like domain-containing protein [Solirubrobacteraceae bacterium]|nr:TIM44-like domain-containing protein [Solirubrobacteraceae bacterium]